MEEGTREVEIESSSASSQQHYPTLLSNVEVLELLKKNLTEKIGE